MILKGLEGEEFHAHFSHVRETQTRRPNMLSICVVHSGPCVRGTDAFCTIVPVTTGVARCSKHDTFVKALGRQVSLTRALAPLRRELRRALWASYFSQSRVPRRRG